MRISGERIFKIFVRGYPRPHYC